MTITCTLRASKQTRNDSTITWSKSVGREPFRPLSAQDHEQVVRYCWGSSLLVIREPEVSLELVGGEVVCGVICGGVE